MFAWYRWLLSSPTDDDDVTHEDDGDKNNENDNDDADDDDGDDEDDSDGWAGEAIEA